MITTGPLRDLRLQIAQYFSLDELKMLVFDLDVDWDELDGMRKSVKVQALIAHLGQYGRLQDLIDLLRQERPHVPWADVPSPAEQKTAVREAFQEEKQSRFALWSGRADLEYDFHSPQHQTNRENMIFNMRHSWIEPVLEQALHETVYMELALTYDPTALARQMQYWEGKPGDLAIPTGTPVRELFEKSGRALLILGAPGSGKTFTLLELCRNLLDTAAADPFTPLPVVLNLSNWAEKQGALDAWIIEQIHLQYQLARRVSQAWLDVGQVCLLLDGLDEVRQDVRDDCVTAVNAFKEEYPLPLVVCSRQQDYESLSRRLNLSSAVVIQPLQPEQIEAYLTNSKLELDAVYTAVQEDDALQELSQTPLMLSIMALAYRGVTLVELRPLLTNVAQRRQHLFDAYIRRMFTRPRLDVEAYLPHQSLTWLAYLARQLTDRSEFQFFLENLQPDWLPANEQHRYRWLKGLVFGLIFGLVGGLGVGLVGLTIKPVELLVWQRPTRRDVLAWLWLSIGLGDVMGVATGLGGGLIGGSATFVISGLFFGSVVGPVVGLGVGLIFGLIFGLVGGPGFGPVVGLGVGLVGLGVGLVSGLVFGLIGFLETSTSQQRVFPNQGIYQSGGNMLKVGLVSGLVVGLVSGLSKFGGDPYISHYLLRWRLHRTHLLPFRLQAFLDAMSACILLQRTGAHYRFIHRTLQEHFASLTPADINTLAQEIAATRH